MEIRFKVIELKKRYPLAISRGISTGSKNLFVEIEDLTGHVGLGECAPGTGFDETLAPIAQAQLEELWAARSDSFSINQVYQLGRNMGINASALAALDMALWDLLGKKCSMPLYRIFGLGIASPPTSVTIGLNTVEVTKERVPEILSRTGAKSLKIKLGSPQGIDHDKEHFEAARMAAANFEVSLRVDANGGWTVPNAKHMMHWLADREVGYVEQPLAKGEEGGLPELFENRPLPIFADESCHFASDVPALADRVDGVNLKLMKCGGPSEALRIIAAAKAHGLMTMIGCMGESSVSISAGAAMGELFDYIDLDSQLNLAPDPCTGAKLIDGVVSPTEAPGHGAWYACDAE